PLRGNGELLHHRSYVAASLGDAREVIVREPWARIAKLKGLLDMSLRPIQITLVVKRCPQVHVRGVVVAEPLLDGTQLRGTWGVHRLQPAVTQEPTVHELRVFL